MDTTGNEVRQEGGDALKVLKGLAVAADPVAPKPTVGPLLLGMGAASRYLGVSRSTLWRVIKAGTMEKVELFPGSYRVRRTDLEDLAQRRMPEGGFVCTSRRGRPRKSDRAAAGPRSARESTAGN
ncbi:MAG: helix-turn-helix domain-containing protein [Lentisphaerae bacterium]|nr:helix-turn-helix domain-containing protein [Lentisphaerota bacterium]